MNILELYTGLGTARAVRDYAIAKLGVDLGSIRSVQRKIKAAKETNTETKPIASGKIQAPDKQRDTLVSESGVFVFTSAQNNTLVHENFLASLLRYCEHRSARLVVSKFTYNKSGFQNSTKDDSTEWYDPRLKEYFVNESCVIAKDLIFCGELDILPTAERPLQGFRNYTQNCSGIIPHAKMQLLSLPRVEQNSDPRFLYSTGAITQRNYIQRCAGQKAEFHHVFGALVVEIDAAGDWFARQLIASEDGSFYDLDKYFTPHDILYQQRVESIVYGDMHCPYEDYNTMSAIDSMISCLKPKKQFLHDLVDFRSVSHHDKGNRILLQYKHEQKVSLSNELFQAVNRLSWFNRALGDKFDTIVYVVSSNHDEHLTKFLNDPNGQFDYTNSPVWFSLNATICDTAKETNVLKVALYGSGFFNTNTVFLGDTDSEVIKGVEHGIHGHRGINGAKGSPESFRSIGYKCTTGHTHSCGIIDGVYTVGTSSSLDLGYNKGPTSWSHSHCVMYSNGKRSIITNRGNKWRK